MESAAAADPAPQRYDLSARASVLDPRAREYPELGFVFGSAEKPEDLEHACVDTRVAPQGKLVIWLMGHNQELFNHVSSYGLHAIQVHYARGWYPKLYAGAPPADDLFLSMIRLEAATGEDFSGRLAIEKPDGIMERSYQFLRWLAREHPQGGWQQFLSEDGNGLRWEKVILAGISHGATTAARLAKHQRVARVVMFSGPRDQYEVWQQGASATPTNCYFGFSHVLDEGWKNDHYARSWIMLGLPQHGAVVNVEQSAYPYGKSRRLISDADVGGNPERAHNASAPGSAAIKKDGKFIHEDVWRYLFTHPVGESGAPVPPEPDVLMDQRKGR
jgi:hypothetical protein